MVKRGSTGSAGGRPRARTLRWENLMAGLAKGVPRGVYAFCGGETFLKQETLEAMKRAVSGGGGDRYALQTFRAGESDVREIHAAASQAGLFGTGCLVLVEEIERLGRANARDKAVWGALTSAPGANPVVLNSVFQSRELARRAKFLAGLLGQVTVVDFWELSTAQAETWISKRAARQGLTLTPAAAQLLVRYLGTDLHILTQEVEKIQLLHEKPRLGVEDLRALARGGIFGSAWECVQAVLEGHLREALERLQAVRRQETAFSFAWKLGYSASEALRAGQAGGGGWRPGPRMRPRTAAEKKLLGRLLGECYQWEYHQKRGLWSGSHDFVGLETLIVGHADRARRLARSG